MEDPRPESAPSPDDAPAEPTASSELPALPSAAAPPDTATSEPSPPVPDLAPPLEAELPEPPPLPPEATEANPRTTATFEFHGQEGEYFRIWIINTLLTLLSLGLFSAWAKVRKRRYLRGNTRLLGQAFHYTANPWRILVGNLIVATIFLTYSFFGAVYPAARVAAIVIGILMLPWVVVRSLAFNANNTLYRGMRLRFRSGLAEAFVVYLVLPVLFVFSLGLYYPAWLRRKQVFVTDNHRFGDAFFSFHGQNGPFYRAVMIGGLIALGGLMTLGLSIGAITALQEGVPPAQSLILAGTVLFYGSALFTCRHYIYPRVFNHIWNHTQLDENRFSARMAPGHWMKLQWTNLLAIIGSCGLAYPWATIRTTRYTLSCLSFNLTDAAALDRIDTMGAVTGSAVGESAAEFVGVDFGL